MTEIVNISNIIDESIRESIILVNNECPICYEIIGEKNNCNTPCGHSFCFSCIAKILFKNNKCPYCRKNLSDQNICEYDEEDIEEEEIEEEEIEVQETLGLFINHITNEFKYFRSYIINEIRKYFDRLDSSKIKKFKNCNLKIFLKIYIKEFGLTTTKYDKNSMKKIYDIFLNNSENVVDFVDYNKYLSDKFIKQKKLEEKKLQKKIKNNKTSNKPYFRI
jgi:glutaredoxin